MAWGVFEQDGWIDVAPVVTIDGEGFMSDAHEPGERCQCHPRMEWQEKYGMPMWIHNDPDADEVPTKQ